MLPNLGLIHQHLQEGLVILDTSQGLKLGVLDYKAQQDTAKYNKS
jgi:hypothetical protein